MKLTDHQKRIVDKIIDGDVFDIPSYLRVFEKGHEQQYTLDHVQATFEKCESGRTFIFKEDNHDFYTEIYDRAGQVCKKVPISNRMTYQFKDYPIDECVEARLNNAVQSERVDFEGQIYSLNFLKNKYLVADSFSDIRDFVALWSYLNREALIFMGKKPINEEDFSIFFELTHQDIEPVDNPKWSLKTVIDSANIQRGLPTCHSYWVPEKPIDSYLEHAWKINYENLAMCKDFVGVKMMATSELLVFRQKGYKTVEERSQRNNLVAAWVAVFISLVSVFIGNIMPLFQKADADYLEQISQQIASLEDRIDGDTSSQDILTELNEIHDDVAAIMEALDQDPSEELISAVEDIATQIGELNRILEEGQNNGQGTK